jgi:hypothetical protein
MIPSSDKYFAKEIAFGKGLKPLVQERFTRIWYEISENDVWRVVLPKFPKNSYY